MVSKNNKKILKEEQANKVTRYAIKRLSVGTASVAVAACLFFSGGSVASAQELVESTNPNTEQDSSTTTEFSEDPVVQPEPVQLDVAENSGGGYLTRRHW